MVAKSFRKKITFLLLFFSFLLFLNLYLGQVEAGGAGTSGLVDCYADPENEQCKPPSLWELQGLVITVVYYVWVAGIPIFTGAVIFVGYQYMTSLGDPSGLEEVKKKVVYVVVGVVIFIGANPIAAGIMKIAVNSTTDCYAGLEKPGFTFFFPTVCSGGDPSGSACDADKVGNRIGGGGPAPDPVFECRKMNDTTYEWVKISD